MKEYMIGDLLVREGCSGRINNMYDSVLDTLSDALKTKTKEIQAYKQLVFDLASMTEAELLEWRKQYRQSSGIDEDQEFVEALYQDGVV